MATKKLKLFAKRQNKEEVSYETHKIFDRDGGEKETDNRAEHLKARKHLILT